MTWFPLLFSTLTTALLAALLYAMPSITPPTLPLGVSVPLGRTQEPVIRRAVRRFRAAVIVVLLVCIALGVTLSFVAAVAPAVRVLVPVLLFVVLGIGSYVVARSGISRAKRAGNWYRGLPVRLTADVTIDHTPSRVPVGWYIAAVVPLIIAAGIGAALYPSLPDPLPVHWNVEGIVDRFAAKSVWTVFGVLLLGLGLVGLLFALSFAVSFAVRLSPTLRFASDTPETAAHRGRVQRRLATGLLGQLALAIAFELSVLAVISWSSPTTEGPTLVHAILLIALIAGIVALYVVRYRHAMSAQVPMAGGAVSGEATPIGSESNSSGAASASSAARAVVETRPDVPDDDRYWKAGFVYVNRNDPALLVPKRFGIGWTVNLGHPAGIAIGVLLLVIIGGSITVAALAGPHR